MKEIQSIVEQFLLSYNRESIEEDTVGYFNDAYMMINYFKEIENTLETQDLYKSFISEIIKYQDLLKEYSNFDFNTITNFEDIIDKEINNLQPIFTTFSFTELEEMLIEMVNEMKVEKEFKNEIKNEIEYLLEEYEYHYENLLENIKYNFYKYTEIEASQLQNEALINDFIIEKRKFKQSIFDKLKK